MRQLGTNVSLTLWITLVLITIFTVKAAERRFACWGSFGPPVVSAQCPRNTIIRVTRAGLKVQSKPGECLFQEEDCGCEYGEAGCQMPNVANLCIGKPACRLDVTQQYIITDRCRGFSDYMYIDFDCVPVEKSVADVCSQVNVQQNVGLLGSPHYPQQLSGSTNCQCSLSPAKDTSMFLSIVEMHMDGAECSRDIFNVQFNGGVTPLCDKSDGYTQKLGPGHVPVHLSLKTGDKPVVRAFLLKYEGEDNSTVSIRCGAEVPGSPDPQPSSEQEIKAWTPPDINTLFKMSKQPTDKELQSSRFVEVPTIKPYLQNHDKTGILHSMPVRVEKAQITPDQTALLKKLLKANKMLNTARELPNHEKRDDPSTADHPVLPKIELEGISLISREKVSRRNFAASSRIQPKPPDSTDGSYSSAKINRLGYDKPGSLLGRTKVEERNANLKKILGFDRIMPADDVLLTTEKAPFPTFETIITNEDGKQIFPSKPISRQKGSNAKIIRHRVGAPVEILPTIPASSDKLGPTQKPWWWKLTAPKPSPSKPNFPRQSAGQGQKSTPLSQERQKITKNVNPAVSNSLHERNLQQTAQDNSHIADDPSRTHLGKSIPSVQFYNGQSPLHKTASTPTTEHDANSFPNNYLDEYDGMQQADDYKGSYEEKGVVMGHTDVQVSPDFIDDSESDFIDLMEKIPFEQEKAEPGSKRTKIRDYDPIPLHQEETKKTKAPFITALDPIALDAETERIKNKNNVVPFILAQDPIPLHQEPKHPKSADRFHPYDTDSSDSEEYEYYYYDDDETESQLENEEQTHQLHDNIHGHVPTGKDSFDDTDKAQSDNSLLRDFLESKLNPNPQNRNDDKWNLRPQRKNTFQNRDRERKNDEKDSWVGVRSENYKISVGAKRRDPGRERVRLDRRDENHKKTDTTLGIKRRKPKEDWIDMRSDYDKETDQSTNQRKKNGYNARAVVDMNTRDNTKKRSRIQQRESNTDGKQGNRKKADPSYSKGSSGQEDDEALNTNNTNIKEMPGKREGIIRGNKPGDNQPRKKFSITEKESTMVTIIAAGAIGGIVLIVVLGVVVRFIMNRSSPQHAMRQHRKRECVIRRNGQRMMMARKGKPFAKSYS